MIKILNKNGEILKDVDADSMSYANLRGADLSGANLIIITWSHWTTYITKGHIRIGCQYHTLAEWRGFSDSEIVGMDPRAIDFWRKNKELIIGLCERFEEKEATRNYRIFCTGLGVGALLNRHGNGGVYELT